MGKKRQKRFWEIDCLRGLAVSAMVVSHILLNLEFFDIYEIDIQSKLWFFSVRPITIIFILLVGISLALSFSRTKQMKKTTKGLWKKYFKRGIRLFVWGLIITLITRIAVRENFIAFGILHLFGISIILAYPFLKFRQRNLILGLILILIGTFLRQMEFDFPWLLWLGFPFKNFQSIDYFPLLPWFGFVLIGLFLGNQFYANYQRQFKLKNLSNSSLVKSFCFLGRYSLFIYFVHQPILIGMLIVLGFLDWNFFFYQ